MTEVKHENIVMPLSSPEELKGLPVETPKKFEIKPGDVKVEERPNATGAISIRVTYIPANISVEARGYSRGKIRRDLGVALHMKLVEAGLIPKDANETE